jgi:hypothetical protein
MMLATCVLVLALAAPADTLPRGGVRGVVQSEQSGLPVNAAVVEVSDSGGIYRSLSDSLGTYRLGGLPAGTHRVRVRHLEHEPLEVEVTVPQGAEVVMDVSLRFRPVPIDTLHATTGTITRSPNDTVAAERPELARAETHGVEGNPAGGNVMPVPGDPSTGDPGDFQIRGSAADLRLVLLDGAPVYAPFHMGGLLEAFEPSVLGAARLHLAGAPARFDGGLSYVMELATRSGASEHTTRGSVDMVAVRATAEGPLAGSASYLVAGRSVHGATLERLEGNPFPYQFHDGLLRLDLPLGAGGRLRGTAFGNREAVRLDPDAGDAGFARWRNGAGSLRYNGFVLGLPAEATVAVSDFHAWIPQTRTGPLEGVTQRLRILMEISRVTGPFRLRYGASYDDVRIRNQIAVPALGSTRLVRAELGGSALAGFGDAVWQASPRVLLRGGARLDVFSERVAITVSPRLAATWLVGDQAALTVAAGRFHQYLRARRPEAQPGTTLVENAQYALDGELRVAGASHLSVGLDQQLSEVRLGVEGFYKRFSGIPEAGGLATHTSGFDVWARRAAGPVSGWVGYTLSWTWSEQDTSEVEFVGRHVLSAGASGQLGRRGRFSMRLQFGGPLPGDTHLSPVANAPELGGVPLTGEEEGGDLEVDAPVLGSTAGLEYVRLDAQLSRTWQPVLAGRRTELTPYLRVINALDRRDPLFYRYNGGGASPEAVATLPLLPVLGFDWRF